MMNTKTGGSCGPNSIGPMDALQDFKHINHCNSRETLKILQKLLGSSQRRISGSTSDWQPLLLELLSFMTTDKLHDRRLLAGRIVFSILSQTATPKELEVYTRICYQVDAGNLQIFGKSFTIPDPEIFKLIIINSHLHVSPEKIHSFSIYVDFFRFLQKHCSTYTHLTFLSFRLLKLWLHATKTTTIWAQNDELEGQLEALIISNWDNCINDAAKWNSTEIFPMYLDLMNQKYPKFLKKSWDLVLDHSSWRNPTKFTILTATVSVMKSPPQIPDFHIQKIVRSLTKSHLKHPSTKLYLTTWGKMGERDWLKFYKIAHPILKGWEQEDHLSALQLFWDLWMKPVLPKYSDSLFYDLWTQLFRDEMTISQSFFAKIAVEKGIELKLLLKSNVRLFEDRGIKNIWRTGAYGLPHIMNDARDCVRLNAFAIYCRASFATIIDYEICKKFLYFNAKAASTQSRRSLLDSFRHLLERISRNPIGEHEIHLSKFLHRLILNCFELGSCYQRKIIGLSLLEMILEHTHKSNKQQSSTKRPQEATNDLESKRHAQQFCEFTYNDKESFHSLIRLCLDTVDEIRSKACDILCSYFDPDNLTAEELKNLYDDAVKYCRSWKFYEASGGSKLLKVLVRMERLPFSTFLLEEAKAQLLGMRRDLLKATTEGAFFGTLAALIETIDLIGERDLDKSYITSIVELLEEASSFFLASLSPTDPQYSSSFAEMGIAIESLITNSEISDESDHCTLSPAHQTILSCIWMSLATICELSGRLTCLDGSGEVHEREIDVVVNVLMKCRHKGVIEAAGVVLGRIMNNENLGGEYFKKHLQKVLSLNLEDKIDLTRRGAGLTIMFHRLISNGSKLHRPLLQYALDTILKSLTHLDLKIGDHSVDNPLARQLHFLRSAVTDKSLHQHLLPYLEDISLICLLHVRSPEWSIRNGSLQLLGAVVPRLVGQVDSGHSIEHFYTHYPNLAERLLEELDGSDDGVIMPVLTLLSKMSVSGEDYIDHTSGDYIRQVLQKVFALFDHSTGSVRDLAAKTYAAFVPAKDICTTISCMGHTDLDGYHPNFRHGYLMSQVYLNLRARYESVSDSSEYLGRAAQCQLSRLQEVFSKWCRDEVEINYVVESTFIKCLLTSPQIGNCSFRIDRLQHSSIIRKIGEEDNRAGFWEFLHHLVELHSRFDNFDRSLIDCPEVFSEIGKYNVCVMKNANIGKAELGGVDARLDLLKILLRKMDGIGDDRSLTDLADVFEFVLKVLESTDFSEKSHNPLTGMKIISKIMKSESRNLTKLGHLIGLIFSSDLEYERIGVDFICQTIQHDEETEKLWALDCLQRYLTKKSFFDISRDLQLRVIEVLVVLLTDESPEVRAAVSNIFTSCCVVKPREDFIPNHPEIYLHEVLQVGVSLLSTDSRNLQGGLRAFVGNILNDRHLRKFSGIIESPFNYEEAYREDAKLLNVITQLTIEQMNSTKMATSPNIEHVDVDLVMEIGRKHQDCFLDVLRRDPHSCQMFSLLDMKLENYVSYKLGILEQVGRDPAFVKCDGSI